MPSVNFRRVRARVTELGSEESVTDEARVQRAVATPGGAPRFPYPSVESVDREQGIWDLYLPEDLVQALDEQQADTFRIEAEGNYVVLHFLDRG